ncbi:hypothetical protein JCM6882_007289 [Rhodosporidiobolus microsporus]
MSRPSDRTAYTSLPPSTSSSSLQTVNLASPPTASEPKQSGFFFTSLSSVWSGLRAQADGFLRGVGGGAGSGEEGGRVGEKRERNEGAATVLGEKDRHGDRRKRRRMEQQQHWAADDFLFDGVPPLMPPISHASPLPKAAAYSSSSSHFSSSSPIASRSALPSSSPETSRSILRPYADPSYADTLMHAASTGEDILPPIAEDAVFPSRNSTSSEHGGLRSLSGRRKLSVQGVPSAPEAKTSALAGRYGHGRTQSYASNVGVPLPNPRHVHFALVSSSTSLPNLAALAGEEAAPTKSPSTPRRSGASTSSKSPSSGSKRRTGTTPQSQQVGSILFGDSDLGSDVSRVWREAKEEERRRKEELRALREGREKETQERREKRIRELEDEVDRLKGELSAKKEPPPASFPKSPRLSVPPPPPPAPPPPPIGRPHPLLLSARQSLKATPPRPNMASSTKLKRRLSTLGGEGSGVDMGAFLEELGGKRGKLRKVGLPELRKKEEKRDGGELGDVLHRAFARKFSGTASPSTPHLPTSRSTFTLSSQAPLKNPDWSSPHPSSSRLVQSHSHPAGLSSLSTSAEADVPPVPPLPAQPVFVPAASSRSASAYSSKLPPRSSSLVSTSTTIYGQALSTDDPAASAPAPVAEGAALSSSISPSASMDSLAGMTSAPPETFPSLPPSTPGQRAPEEAVADEEDREKAASERLSRARRRSGDGSPLPGLDVGRARPVTPGRAKAKRLSLQESGGSGGQKRSRREGDEEEEDEVVLVEQPVESAKGRRTPSKAAQKAALAASSSSPAKKRRTPTRSAAPAQEREERYEHFEEEVLSGVGAREADAGRVFGRA